MGRLLWERSRSGSSRFCAVSWFDFAGGQPALKSIRYGRASAELKIPNLGREIRLWLVNDPVIGFIPT